MSVSIDKLKVGDLVSDDLGNIGKVKRFTIAHVVIEWESGELAMTDAELKARGVVLVKDAL